MPFELGMDIGCKRFGKGKLKDKCLLILDEERYRYQRAISDLSGNDIEKHSNNPLQALRKLRNWIYKFENKTIDSSKKIWRLYNEFRGDFYTITKQNELSKEDIDDMPWNEYYDYIRNWKKSRLG